MENTKNENTLMEVGRREAKTIELAKDMLVDVMLR